MKTSLLIALLLCPSLRADTTADIRTALASLRGAAPIHATFELQRSRKAQGRFANNESNGSATVDVVADPTGLRITFSQPLLERATTEAVEHQGDPKKSTPVRSTLAEIDATTLSDDLDYARAMLRLLAIAKPISESKTVWQGHPAHLLVMKLNPKLNPEATTVFHVNFSDDTLRLWVGADNIPLAAERIQRGTAGFLFLKGEMKNRQSWVFSRYADRLLVTRYESSFAGSGFGQRGEGKNVQIVAVH
ncbi:MAG: hypothetical protein ABIP63_02765 [Thermoanaerobaculia bacterium]